MHNFVHSYNIINIKELENKLADNKDLELSRKEKLEQINNIIKILKQYKGLTKFNEDIFNNLVDRIIIGEKLDNGKEDLYKIKFILKTGEMIKDNLSNNKLKIGSDIGHYGFSINKQSLEIKEDNVSAYVLRKNPNVNTCYFFIFIHIFKYLPSYVWHFKLHFAT